MNVSKQSAGRGVLRRSEAWIYNTIDWEYSSNLSLMSISSYVEYKTGNIYGISIACCGYACHAKSVPLGEY